MIVLRCVVNLEDNRNLGIEKFDLERREIGFCIEDQSVDTARQRLFNQKEWFDATIFIGPGMTEFSPAFVCVLQVQADRYTAGGRASRDVEYVR